MKNYQIVRYEKNDYAVTLDHVIIAELPTRRECEDMIKVACAIDEDDFLTLLKLRA